MMEFRPIKEAHRIAFGSGTVADLKMHSGRTYRATWDWRGNCCAWWPALGQARKNPIGLYEPKEFAVIACGIGEPPFKRVANA